MVLSSSAAIDEQPNDQIVHPSAKLVRNATLKIYLGGSHSLGDTPKEQLNADLLAFNHT